MDAYLPILIGTIERGMLCSLVVMAVYLTSRIMKFDDFSIEGTFGLGGAMAAWAAVHHIHPWIGLLLGTLVGGAAGTVTGTLHAKLGLNKLIAGIVMTTILFSISLNMGPSNFALGDAPTIFTLGESVFYRPLVMLSGLAFLIAGLCVWYMRTESGFLLRATGVNTQFVTALGKDPQFYLVLSLMIGNALSGLAGSLFVQYSGFYSVFGNVGTLVAALAGCMMAELLPGNMFIMSIGGAVLYQTVIALALECQVDASWQKLVTGLLIVVLLLFKKIYAKELTQQEMVL